MTEENSTRWKWRPHFLMEFSRCQDKLFPLKLYFLENPASSFRTRYNCYVVNFIYFRNNEIHSAYWNQNCTTIFFDCNWDDVCVKTGFFDLKISTWHVILWRNISISKLFKGAKCGVIPTALECSTGESVSVLLILQIPSDSWFDWALSFSML